MVTALRAALSRSCAAGAWASTRCQRISMARHPLTRHSLQPPNIEPRSRVFVRGCTDSRSRIGANIVVFSVVNTILLRPLPSLILSSLFESSQSDRSAGYPARPTPRTPCSSSNSVIAASLTSPDTMPSLHLATGSLPVRASQHRFLRLTSWITSSTRWAYGPYSDGRTSRQSNRSLMDLGWLFLVTLSGRADSMPTQASWVSQSPLGIHLLWSSVFCRKASTSAQSTLRRQHGDLYSVP
jgi:hypothetical protein